MEVEGEWKRQEVPLHFRLGDRTVFSIRLTLFVGNGFLKKETSTDSIPSYKTVRGKLSVDGYLVRSEMIKNRMPKLSLNEGWLRFIPRMYDRYYIDLSGTFQEYTEKFSKKSLSTLKRKMKRFKDHSGGEIDWRTYQHPDQMEEFHRTARKISEITYQERLLDAGLPDEESFKDKMLFLSQKDRVRGYLLFYQEIPISYLYCPVYDGKMVYQYLGYDPRYAKWSPGTILQWLALEKIFSERKFTIFDFTEGENEHKRFFGTHSIFCGDVYFLPPGLGNYFWIVCLIGNDHISAKTGMLLEKLHLKKVARAFMRRSA